MVVKIMTKIIITIYYIKILNIDIFSSNSGSRVPMLLIPQQSDKQCIPSNQVIYSFIHFNSFFHPFTIPPTTGNPETHETWKKTRVLLADILESPSNQTNYIV